MLYDFENKLAPQPKVIEEVQVATHAEVLFADVECKQNENALLLPFATAMVSDSDRESIASAYADALGMDTEGLKDMAKDFWKWIKKLWSKFKKSVLALYKKIKGFLGFKEKEIDNELKDIDGLKEAEYTLNLVKVAKADSLNTVSEQLEVLLDGVPDTNNQEEFDKWMGDTTVKTDTVKKELETLQKSNKVDFHITEAECVEVKDGDYVGKVTKDIENMVADIKGLSSITGIFGVTNCEVEVKPEYLYPVVKTMSLYTANGIKKFNIPKGIVVTTDIYGENKLDYKENLEQAKELISEINTDLDNVDKFDNKVDILIKENEGSEDSEAKQKVKKAQTNATIAKEQITAKTKVVNNVPIVKNKRSKNPKYKNKKKSK